MVVMALVTVAVWRAVTENRVPARRAVARASASRLAAPRTEFVAPLRSRVAAIIEADGGWRSWPAAR
jgi:hypothetical protein